MKSHKLATILLLCCIPHLSFSQYLINPSLDGDNEMKRPWGWHTCDMLGNSPDMLESFSDDFTLKTYSKIDGEQMCLLRTRGVNFATINYRRTFEHISSKLQLSLEPDKCYQLKIHLCYVPTAKISDEVVPNISYPLRFQVWGANDSCSFDAKLIDTEPITNESFQEYTFNFVVEKEYYDYIYIRPYWDTINVVPEPYSGILLLDKLDLQLITPIPNQPEDTLLYSEQPPLQLKAPKGAIYAWEPKNYLSEPNIQSPFVTYYNEKFKVTVTNDVGCEYHKSFHVIFSCETLHPISQSDSKEVYYKIDQKVQLMASSGKSYFWHLIPGLSAYGIQSPIVEEYQPNFKVSILDRFDCEYTESFNMLIHCDSLYEERNMHHPDTSLEPGTELTLLPYFKTDLTQWQPSNGLSCNLCPETTATVWNPTVYTASITDAFNCVHKEIFPLNVKLIIPNVITPGNGAKDGKNDVFKIYGLSPNTSLYIYDKSGLLVFKSQNYNSENWWDGTNLNNDLVQTGTYWYILEPGNKATPIKGFVFVKND